MCWGTARWSRKASWFLLVAALVGPAVAGCGTSGPGAEADRATGDRADAVEATPRPDETALAVADLVAAEGPEDEPGCAVGVARDGTTVYEGGYGVADLASGRPIDATTTFDIASVSKQFTAAAVLLLEDEGLVGLDDEVGAFLPELPDDQGAVTLEQLLHHTGGLPEYTELLAEEYEDTDVTTTAQALDAVVRAGGTEFPPGTEFAYSNTGYFLLGLVVERVSGVSLGEFVDDEVFAPLGMDASVVRDDADLDVPDGAEGYSVGPGGGYRPNTTNWEQAGDGAVWSSVRDLLVWADNLSTFALGGETLREGMLTPGPVPDEEGYGYGGGLVLGDGEIEHSGSWAGFSSQLIVAPAPGVAAVVLCNRDDAEVYDLAARVLDLVVAGP